MSQCRLNRAVTIADVALAAGKRISDLEGETVAEWALRRNRDVRNRVEFAACYMRDAPAIDRDDAIWLDVCAPVGISSVERANTIWLRTGRILAPAASSMDVPYDFVDCWNERYPEIAAIPADAKIEEGRTL